MNTKTETQHTPGPWRADGYTVRQSGQHGSRMIADICYTGPHHTPPDEYPPSCRLADEANARLIAAAPDLLTALTGLVEAEEATIEGFDAPEIDRLEGALETAREAIAKAKGAAS